MSKDIRGLLSEVNSLIKEYEPSGEPLSQTDYNVQTEIGEDVYQQIWNEGYDDCDETYKKIITTQRAVFE